ncbi:hypothetical protein [Pseudomonas syringae group genomosp. 3]|uniref:hypothetical protein n=1 Tax=Pseudomonas syringae group genomosp. 3 TaxID=251701 RepID=UPI001908BD7C|nr:hypothetical protein [Pseudomonas syringae group genomosp. 3]QQN29314.1 hypothetical protein JHZ65_10235 [Pseudomonas syringae pv. maculicola]
MTNKPNDVRVVPVELLEKISQTCMFTLSSSDYEQLRAILAQPADQHGEPPRATEKDIERWHALIAESPEGPWVMGNGGSFDRQGVKPISDELMSELGQWLRMGYTPWNGRSVSPTDRQFMYLLYYSVQGLVSRVRRAERDLHHAQPADQQGEPFQGRVEPWMTACFGAEISADRQERNHRFLEESLELVQACGATSDEAHQLVDYVYGRPTGEPDQEVGGVMVTLAALCLAHHLDMHASAETELSRIWTKVDQIRAKQAAKPAMSLLPGAYPERHAQPVTAKVVLRAEARECREFNHVGINDESSGSACHSCDWSGGHQAEDKCPGCGDENCMAAACPKCGGRYVLIAEASLNTPQ